MDFDFITIPEEEHLRLQIEEYKRTMIKDRETIVKLREERDYYKNLYETKSFAKSEN